MFAPRILPPEFEAWNRKWNAPYGRHAMRWPLRGTRFDLRRRGPFAWQSNNSTREFEYPWAYSNVTQHGKSLTIVDLGGSLCGMQFVLALEGHRVINVDPGLNSRGVGWDVDLNVHRWISARLGTSIEVITETLPGAQLPEHSVDVVLCVSSLEHFSEADVADTALEIPRILKPDGICVFTVDCFLDLAPFTNAIQNKWGRNASVYEFLKQAGLGLKAGKEDELLGFPDFEPRSVLNRLPEYHVGRGYPCLAQCFVASPARVASHSRSRDGNSEHAVASLLAAQGV